MKILVIGCNGFIGSNIYRYLSTKKYDVYGADIHVINAQTFLLRYDLSNLPQLFNHQKFDVCINASGSSTVRFSITNEQEDYQLNYLNVKKIIEVILQLQPTCKFINLSSAAVYGNPKQLPIKENDHTFPISPYGKHKLLSEELLFNENLNHQLSSISLRIFSVYGNALKKQLFWDICCEN
jgi:dTDP-glucose 4,6-dehydratase/UDP-glucose 4-epimerase